MTNVPLLCVKLEPVTVIDWPIGPVVGLLLIEGGVTSTVKVPALCILLLLPLPTEMQTGYALPTVDAVDGQVREPLINEPSEPVEAVPIGLGELQSEVPHPILTVLLVTQLFKPSTTLFPLTVND